MIWYTFLMGWLIKYMSYTDLILILTLLSTALSYTDITMFNCPAQFNVPAYNTSTDTTVANLGAFIYSGFQSQSSKKRVESIVNSGNTADLDRYIGEMQIPYIIAAVVFMAGYLFVVVCCLFDRSCPPCESLRRDMQAEPYTKREIRCSCLCTLFISLGIVVVTLISFTFISPLKANMEMTSCSIYLGIDSAINGDEKWGGFVSLRDKVGNITNLLSAAVTQINTEFLGDQWLVDSMQTLKTSNLNIYKTYNASQLITPNPEETAKAANAGQNTPKIDSRFIRTGMGPNGTSNTMITDIDLGLRSTEKLSNQAYAIKESAIRLKNSQSSIISNSVASQNTLLMYIHQLGNMKAEFDTFSSQYFDKNFTAALSIYQGIFAFVLTGSMLAILGVIATHLCNLYSCRGMVHLGWTVYGLAYIGVLVVTFGTLSVGSIGYGFCNYLKDMLTVEIRYKELGLSYTQNSFMRLDVCIFGDGDAMKKFSLRQEMGTVEDLFKNIQTYNLYNNILSTDYVNLGISTSKIQGWMNAIQKYKLGIYIDTNPSITNNDNPNEALKQLNLYTYQGGGVATGSKDVWVWDKANCTDPTQIIYTAGSSAGLSLSTSNVTCISFNEKLISTAASSWSFSDFTMRYVQIRNDFQDAFRFIQTYGATLIAFRDSRFNLFRAIEDELSAMFTLNTNFNTQMDGFKTKVSRFESSVFTLNNLITDTQSGLIYTSNCRSLGDKMRFTYNVFCVNMMAQVVKICVCCLVLLILLLGGVLCGSRFGIIYAELELQVRISQPMVANEINSEKEIDLKHNETNSSHSSSDDERR